MNQRYLDYALYNIWANNRLIMDLQEQDDSIFTRKVVSSFPSIRSTILHIWYAENKWLNRMTGQISDNKKIIEFASTNQELCKQWSLTSEAFKDYSVSANIEKLISFEHNGETFSIPSREIIHTVCTHGSYHRGQIVMMMRQLDIDKITQTDYIEWVREKERGNI